VKPQICAGSSQYARCSTNNACGCFHTPGAGNTGICAVLWVACSALAPCQSSNNACSKSDQICVNHPRCHLHPVCYPVSMIDRNICPPIVSKRINNDLKIQLRLKSFFKSVFFTIHTLLTCAISVSARTVKKNWRAFGKVDKMRCRQNELYLLEKTSNGWYPIVLNEESVALLYGAKYENAMTIRSKRSSWTFKYTESFSVSK
jgi:hypothetical protein